MEGSRHERAVLVILSYVIGFVTAFIAFVISSNDVIQKEIVYIANSEYDYKKYADAAQPETVTQPTQELAVETRVDYTNGRLLIERETTTFLVSINPDEAGFSSENIDLGPQGWHVSQPSYELAPDGSHLFFCEQQSSDATTCRTFLLDIDNNVIRPVKADGEMVDIELADADSVEWYGTRLAFSGFISVDESQPWNLTRTQ